jgi:acetyl esterase/lipase
LRAWIGGQVMKEKLLIAGLLLFFAFPAPAVTPTKTILDVRFGPLPDQKLGICLPTEPIAAKSAVLLIHGGSWIEGDKAVMRGWCTLFARSGIVAATVGYRLAKLDDPSSRWPAQISDVSLAFKWMHEHSDEFGIDPDRICSFGESVGGHLSVWLAIKEKKVACVIDSFGPVNLPTLPRFKRALDALFGQQRSAADERAATPLFYLSDRLPPILIIQGTQDEVVPPQQSDELYEAARNKNIKVKLVTYSGGHSWKGLSPEMRSDIMSEMVHFIKEAPRR